MAIQWIDQGLACLATADMGDYLLWPAFSSSMTNDGTE